VPFNPEKGILPVTQPSKPNRPDPLHGITLATIVQELAETLGWEAMGRAVDIRCFTNNPNLNSSLKFLRRTPWARIKVEELYLWQKLHAGAP
jgi:uncharacterized protein (DUF2132 family)